jgi:hypothetical protein
MEPLRRRVEDEPQASKSRLPSTTTSSSVGRALHSKPALKDGSRSAETKVLPAIIRKPVGANDGTRSDIASPYFSQANNAPKDQCSEESWLVPSINVTEKNCVPTTVPAYAQHAVDDNRATDSRHPPPATRRSGINDRRNSGSQKGPYSAAVEIADCPLATTSHVYWTSFWLRKTTLLTLVALFLGLMISLVAVWFTNKSQNGYRPVVSNNHYGWTYGPTAVLVVVLSFWRQVDYCCKISQPWQALRSGPVNADQSMLLGYLSPLQVTSFIQATKN